MSDFVKYCLCLFISGIASAYTPYGEVLCHHSGYSCHPIQRGDSWGTLFPDSKQRDIVKRVNRTNLFLEPGMIIAIPANLPKLSINDVSPFPLKIKSNREKTIYIDQKVLAWGAYDETGQLVRWGPISPGSNHCLDISGDCLTPKGSFRIKKKQGQDCVSNAFPQQLDGEKGGGAMPYCLNFFKGFALHGSSELPGYPASHGCIRLFIDDAKWLNEQFVQVTDIGIKGTRVIILNSIQ